MAEFRNGPYTPPKIVGDVMRGSTPALENLLQTARKLQKLDQEFKSLLDPAMAENTSVAAVHEHVLVVVASSAALATRLRMDSKSLINALNARGVRNINTLQVKTAPASRSTETHRQKRQLPDIARQSLQRFAEDTGNLELQSSLNKKDQDKKDSDT